ncbi:hypothetical protein H0A36_15295 [Endozoicomonas sp. SM1973]|uniref:Uncharacterized protein n=1 Tax=Spartinivicinus marinus TaxID=2994442 RepID=A0A853IBW8_9GAMM|nr:hypothetical protein [Spartinivicinus marinus]MCX4026205.1 hypothetical protein [Spartinivicinus marinus]NYZ67381.1 hypothetical protein [Spartinivicinus marinus]
MTKEYGNIIIALLTIGVLITLIVMLLFYRAKQETAEIILTRQSYQCENNNCRIKYNILSRAQSKKQILIIIYIYTIINGDAIVVEEPQRKLITPRTYSFHYFTYSYQKNKPRKIEVRLEEVTDFD